MLSPKTLPEVKKLQGELNATPLDPRCISQAVNRIVELVHKFENLPQNRSGNRVRQSIRNLVRKTLAHLSLAARNTNDGMPSRNEARRLIRFTGCCTDFAELAQKASHFRGQHNQRVQSTNDAKARASARRIKLSDDFELKQVKTPRELLSIGRALKNCITRGSYHIDHFRNRENEFWTIQEDGLLRGLMSFDSKTREIEEFAGSENDPVGCSKEILLSILRKLDVSGDDVEEFSDVGAYKLLAEDIELTPTVVSVGAKTLKVWGRTGEALFCDEESKWTKVTFDKELSFPGMRRLPPYILDVSGNLALEEIFGMVLKSAKMRDLINRYRPAHWLLDD